MGRAAKQHQRAQGGGWPQQVTSLLRFPERSDVCQGGGENVLVQAARVPCLLPVCPPTCYQQGHQVG